MLQLLIHDLFQYNKPRFFSFGSSGSTYPYKAWFATHSCEERTFIVLRNTLANRALVWANGLTKAGKASKNFDSQKS
jgi:hypothetical protein